MKKIASLLVLLLVMLPAQAEQSEVTRIKPMDAATSSVMLVAKAICGNKASMDRALVQSNSTAVAFLAAVYTMSGEVSAEVANQIAPKMRCDDQGLLQVDLG